MIPADAADIEADGAAGTQAKTAAGAPAGADAGGDMTAELQAFLDREADHFFQGEMAHERRASWLLALASGLMLALWRLLSADQAQRLSAPALGSLLAALAALAVTVGLCLWALWPLGGGLRPGLLSPWRRRSSWDVPGELPPMPERLRRAPGMLAWNHYVGHRRRAEIKGRRVVWITLALSVALAAGTAGILLSVLP